MFLTNPICRISPTFFKGGKCSDWQHQKIRNIFLNKEAIHLVQKEVQNQKPVLLHWYFLPNSLGVMYKLIHRNFITISEESFEKKPLCLFFLRENHFLVALCGFGSNFGYILSKWFYISVSSTGCAISESEEKDLSGPVFDKESVEGTQWWLSGLTI